jgi:hypothetical protein
MNATDLHPPAKCRHYAEASASLASSLSRCAEKEPPNVASGGTPTLIVNDHGALIQLVLTAEIGQLRGIKNTQTKEELVCRGINLGLDQPGKREMGVEFEAPSPRFWRIALPPSDWTPRSPDAKVRTAHSPGGKHARRKRAS